MTSGARISINVHILSDCCIEFRIPTYRRHCPSAQYKHIGESGVGLATQYGSENLHRTAHCCPLLTGGVSPQGTRVIRTVPRPPSAAGPLAPPSADRARSVSPAALSLAPGGAGFPGADGEDERPRSQPDVGRAASAAPSLFQGLQFDFEGLSSEAGGPEQPEPAHQGEGRQEEGEEGDGHWQ